MTAAITFPFRSAMAGRHRAQPEVSARSYVLAGVALSAASAVAFTPLMVPTAAAGRREFAALAPAVSRTVELAAVVSNADIAALVNRLNASLDAVSTTVIAVVALPGQTLGGALTSAVALNEHLWDGLLAANENPVLKAVLTALRKSSTGGLIQLANTVGDANGTIVLTTGEVANILTSTLTGSLGTALQAVTNVVADPLSAASYTGLFNTPLDLAGGVLTGALTAVNDLGAHALTLTNTLVTGVTAQVTNALSLVNGLFKAAEGVTDFALVDGVLTAVQGIVSAPVTAAVAGVNGLSSTFTGAATDTLDHLTTGASRLVNTWLGNGTSTGALQSAITTIGAAPLSPNSYSDALGTLVGAGIKSGQIVVSAAGSFVSLPFRVASGLTGTAAGVITSLSSGLATFASGILQGVGMSPLVSNLPFTVSAAINAAVNVSATVTQAALNTVAAVLDAGSALTGARTAAVSRTGTDVPALAQSSRTVTLDVGSAATGAPPPATQSDSDAATSADDADGETTASKASDAAAPSTWDRAVAPERPTEKPSSLPADAPPVKTPAAPATTHTAPAGDNGANTTRTTKTPSRTSRDYESARGSGRTSAATVDAAEASGRPTRTGTHRRDSGAARGSTAEPKANSHNDGGG